jgi:hypothetical protein
MSCERGPHDCWRCKRRPARDKRRPAWGFQIHPVKEARPARSKWPGNSLSSSPSERSPHTPAEGRRALCPQTALATRPPETTGKYQRQRDRFRVNLTKVPRLSKRLCTRDAKRHLRPHGARHSVVALMVAILLIATPPQPAPRRYCTGRGVVAVSAGKMGYATSGTFPVSDSRKETRLSTSFSGKFSPSWVVAIMATACFRPQTLPE